MPGRPKLTSLSPKWIGSRNRWQVTVPASWGGKRQSAFFASEALAWAWIADRQRDRANGAAPDIKGRAGGADRDKSVAVLVRLYLEDRKGLASARLLRNHLGKVVAEFGGVPISDISPLAVRAWVSGLPGADRTRWGVFSSCRSLGAWAVRYGLASRNPFAAVEPPDKGDPPKAILTVGQMEALLASEMPGYLRAWIVLGAFAGLRTEEVLRMSWDSVDFEGREIHVPKFAIKRTRGGMRERFVAMLPVFERVCERGCSGAIVPVGHSAFRARSKALARDVLGVADGWPRNCLRHSFASYHLAQWESAARTAHQMGHTSEQMVHQNYARAVRKADAAGWWAIGEGADFPA